MKNKLLGQWLQDHVKMLGGSDEEGEDKSPDQAFHEALYEGIIDMALHGDTRMVDSVLESTAAQAVAVGRGLTNLLGIPQRMRARIWARIGQEIDPEPAFGMLADLDTIFIHIVKVTIEAYLETNKLAQAAHSSEIARLYTDSEKKVMEYAAEVSRANRELAQLEQAKTDFISIAAHELKTPLTLIQGYVNILRDREAGPQAQIQLEGISRGVERMRVIIDDMLDLSTIDMKQLSLMLEPVTLKRTTELIINQLNQAFIKRQQTIRTVNLESLPPIEADVRRLHQILKQLIGNAIKYTPDGGQITITGEIIAASKIKPAYVQITIQDTGVGIAPEDRDRIFEKFYRASDSKLHSTGQVKFMGAGPGLGLAITKGLVEAHGGSIWVESQGFDMQNFPGSSFTIKLPVKANPPPEIQIRRMFDYTNREPAK